MPAPVASASPNGKFEINDHRLISTCLDKKGQIEAVDDAHRFETMNKVYDRGIYLMDFNTQPVPRTVGVRKSAQLANKQEDYRRDNR